MKMVFKLSNLNSNLALTLGYLNPALNNLFRIIIISAVKFNTLASFVLKCLLYKDALSSQVSIKLSSSRQAIMNLLL